MRIVSLSPSFTETLEYVGKADEIVGMTDHCPEKVRPVRIGSPKALQIDRIESLRPDLVLAERGVNRPEEITRLQKKLPVQIFEVKSIQDVIGTVWALGRLLDVTEKAAKLKDEIDRGKGDTAPCPPGSGIPTLLLLWNNPFLTVNFDTYASRLIEASGGWNVFHTEPVPEIPIEIEDMIEKNPSLCLLANEPYSFRKAHVKKLREVRVFSKIQIELVDGKLFSNWGPRTVEALSRIGAMVDSVKHSALRNDVATQP